MPARRLRFQHRRMGFCFAYWSVARKALEKRGIEWRSPQAMNPRVMSDWGNNDQNEIERKWLF